VIKAGLLYQFLDDARMTCTSRRLFLNNLAFNFDNLSLQPYYEEFIRTGKFKPSKNNKGKKSRQ
jgi:hypothetical protein